MGNDYVPLTLVKSLPDGGRIERTVHTPAAEVDARFDGFAEAPPAAPAKKTTGGTAAAASGGTPTS